MEGLGIWLGVAVVLLGPALFYRFKRQAQAKKELEANPTAAKLYTDSGKTISDGIKVHTLNGQKPTLGLDERGNYVILRPGENRLSVGFVGLKDFAVSVAATTATKAPVEAAETQAEIVCQAEPRRNYKIVFDKATSAFSVEPY